MMRAGVCVDSSDDDRVRQGVERTAPGGALERGTTLGRYTVLGLLGQGGMAEVYAAYDPRLDRKIALKLMHPRVGGSGGAGQGGERLLREAKAIARLSHANVVTVHDAGFFGERVFLAMEHVSGTTLSAWLAERPRAVPEILAVFRQAARGLGAAHAAGLVHRDFKPENVMVGEDGTVRVMDFGLARRAGGTDGASGTDSASGTGGAAPAATAAAEATAGAPDALDLSFTQAGRVAGTPRYMAPEHLKGGPTDARSDQFSFCVALHEALFGEHPFLGAATGSGPGGLEHLWTAIARRRIFPVPARSPVPARVQQAVVRGLSLLPGDRWLSMAELVAVLAPEPQRPRRRWVSAVAVATGVAGIVAAVGAARAVRSPAALCQGGPARLAGVWTIPGAGAGAGARHGAPPGDEHRRRLERAFLATGAGGAADTWQRVDVLLDRYAAAWLEKYRDACEATHLRGEQSAEVLDLRMECLDDRRNALQSVTDALATADARTVPSAVDAVIALPALDRCADVKSLRAGTEAPRDAATRARIADLRRRAGVAKAVSDTGRRQQALALARPLLDEARSIGYLPLVAELLQSIGSFHDVAAFHADVIKTREDAIWTALRARRDDIAAESALLLSADLGYILNRRDEGERWASMAEALLDRAGGGDQRLRSWLLQGRAVLHIRANELDEALKLTRQALAIKERIFPFDHPDVARSLVSEAEVLHMMGDAGAALRVADRAHLSLVAAYGPASVPVAIVQNNRGEYLLSLGRAAEALPIFRVALGHWEAALDPDHHHLAYPLTGIGMALVALGRPGQALAPLERALRLRDANEADPAERAHTRFALAQALWAAGQPARATTMAASARDEYRRAVARGAEADRVTAWLGGHSR
jgi:tetratricopeptide (TPR) repeat protein